MFALRVMAAAAIVAVPVAARADDLGLHAGLDLRVDSGAHPIRFAGGVDTGAFDFTLVLDPMVVTDGQFDADLFAVWKLSRGGWGLLGGWRTTAIGIQGGRQYQDKLLVGVAAPLPRLGCLPIRGRFGFELATVVVKHGGGLPTEWISFSEGRDFVDLVNFGMFVTFEYASR
jgi:hypothetical protein